MKTINPWSDDSDDKQIVVPEASQHDDASIEELLAKTDSLIHPEAGTQLPEDNSTLGSGATAKLVRQRLEAIYEDAPDTEQQLAEAEVAGRNRSKHQEFIYNLSRSGKSLVDVQTEWHRYYSSLPDKEKHEVWQEFYEEQNKASNYLKATRTTHAINRVPTSNTAMIKSHKTPAAQEKPTIGDLKNKIMVAARPKRKLTASHHFKSLLFGLGMGGLAVSIILFSFFNERFIAPFISPSRNVSATPIIGAGSSVGPESKILIPKINVEIPVVYDLGTNEEHAVQNALEEGVVHYTGTPDPGQTGNVSIVGHSSNNILNKGKYKFAFVLLNRMESGDTFYLQKGGVRYTYKVFENRVVPPNDVSVLGPSSKPNTATLITCDPPGTSINRRIVVGEQISPDPAGNTASAASINDAPKVLPSNAPSLWSRIFN